MAKFKADNFSGLSVSDDNLTLKITFTDQNENVLNLSFPVDHIEPLIVQIMQFSARAKEALGGLERGSIAIQTDGAGLAVGDPGEFALILMMGDMQALFAIEESVFLNISRRALELAG